MTLLATVKEELGISHTSDDTFFSRKIRQASSAILRAIDRASIARRVVHEGIPAYTRTILIVDETPLLSIAQIVSTQTPQQAAPIALDPSVYTISEKEKGFIFNQDGWPTTEIVGFFDNWNMVLERLPVPANNGMYYADYTAGYIMPGDDVLAATGSGTGYSFLASDGSLNVSGKKFPILVPGDLFTVAGATTPANNGQFTVSTATNTKIVTVENAFTSESAPTDGFGLSFRTLPEDIENAAIQAVKAWYLGRDRDPFVKSERLGGNRAGAYMAEYNTEQALPSSAVELLTKFKRIGG